MIIHIKIINALIWRISRIIHIVFKSEWPLIIRDLNYTNKSLKKKALILYKTDPFILFKSDYIKHTNNWEIIELVKILNNLNFLVDVVDRNANDLYFEDKYDLFIGNAAGPSGKNYGLIASQLNKATKIIMANSPEPYISDKATIERYKKFSEKNNVPFKPLRVRGKDFPFKNFVKKSDYILVCGDLDQYAAKSYNKFNKKIINYYPSTKPLRKKNLNLTNKSKKNFLCFAGDGLIAKGVDIVVEAFLKNPNLNVYICGPNEELLIKGIGQKIKKSSNIFLEGFVTIGSKHYYNLIEKCTFTVLPSASEGCVTSVATVMRDGLIPIVTKECSIQTKNHGILLMNKNYDDLLIELEKIIIKASEMSNNEINFMRNKTLIESEKYTQKSFTNSMTESIKKAIN